jgi:hypothetical protein
MTMPGDVTSSARYAVVFLFCLTLVFGAANLVWTAHEVNAGNAARAREGQMIERKLCTSLDKLAQLHPPALGLGPPSVTYDASVYALVNELRDYDQAVSKTLSQLGPDVGCR